jgi:hypothetical protein
MRMASRALLPVILAIASSACDAGDVSATKTGVTHHAPTTEPAAQVVFEALETRDEILQHSAVRAALPKLIEQFKSSGLTEADATDAIVAAYEDSMELPKAQQVGGIEKANETGQSGTQQSSGSAQQAAGHETTAGVRDTAQQGAQPTTTQHVDQNLLTMSARLVESAASRGKLVLQSDPAGADIEIDSRPLHKQTDTTVWRHAGKTIIRMSKPGYEPLTESCVVEARKEIQFHRKLKPVSPSP